MTNYDDLLNHAKSMEKSILGMTEMIPNIIQSKFNESNPEESIKFAEALKNADIINIANDLAKKIIEQNK